MVNKLDLEKPLFVGKTAVREGTVVDNIRKAVSELDSGEGVSYADLEAHMLKNFTPSKSANYSASYVKSYVRDGVNKYGHLSHENEGNVYEALATPERKPSAPRAAGKKTSKAQAESTEILQFIRDHGQIADASELDSTQITAEDFAEASGRKQKTIDRKLDALAAEGFIRIEERDGNVEGENTRYVFLTAAGYASLSAEVAEEAGSEEAAAEETASQETAEV